MDRNQTKPVAYFQWLRLLAALAVVVMHTTAVQWTSISHETPQWAAMTLWNSLVRWPVPVFVMITGAIFLPRVTDLKRVLTHYIPRMVLAFFLWSGIYSLYSLYRGASCREALLMLFAGKYHLWYLPFLWGIYLVLPFVQKIVTDRRLEDQLLVLSLLIAQLIPWLADLVAALRPDWGDILRAAENNLNYTFFFDLLSMLVLGHWLHGRVLTAGQRRTLYVLGLVGILLTGPATIWISRLNGFQSSLFLDHASPTTILAAAAIFVFAKNNLTRLPRAVDSLARLSFGVYLSHALVIDLMTDAGYHVLSFDPVWSVPVLSAAVFACSLAVTAILSRIPILGNYMA